MSSFMNELWLCSKRDDLLFLVPEVIFAESTLLKVVDTFAFNAVGLGPFLL